VRDRTGWLGFLDAYRTLCIAPSTELRVIFELMRHTPDSEIAQLPTTTRHYGGVPTAEQLAAQES
jgi:hypothetical protein